MEANDYDRLDVPTQFDCDVIGENAANGVSKSVKISYDIIEMKFKTILFFKSESFVSMLATIMGEFLNPYES